MIARNLKAELVFQMLLQKYKIGASMNETKKYG